MSDRMIRCCLMAFFLLVCAPLMAQEEANVKGIWEGSYRIFHSGRPVGVEKFRWTVYDNNTSVLDSKISRYFAGRDTFEESSSLVLEDDSNFPIRYESNRVAGEHVMKLEMEMFANVARFRSDNDGRKSETTKVFPTGCLCVQISTPSHLSLLLNRYDEAAGGKQAIHYFDPVSKQDSRVVLEREGTKQADVEGAASELTLYRLQRERVGEILLYANEEGILEKIVDTLQRTEYHLASLEKH